MSALILFNKPYEVICQFSKEKEELSLADFIPLPDFYPAGRLDKNSEGLLLLTKDGKLQHYLSHPQYNKKKYYWVQVEGLPKEADLKPLRQGLTLGDTQFLEASVQIINEPKLWPRNPPIRFRQSIPTSWLQIILSEGKNHQIRRMTAAIGFPTLRLIRYKIADWSLGDLMPGEYSLIQFGDP